MNTHPPILPLSRSPSFMPSQPDASDFLQRIAPERIAAFCAEVVHTNIQKLQRDNPGKEIVIVYANGSKFYRVNSTPRLGGLPSCIP